MNQRTLSTVLFTAALVATLTGCATRWSVDNEVRSFSALPADAAAAPASLAYRFERLPLQQQDATSARQADALEALVQPELEAAGLRRDEAGARYGVQVAARVTRGWSAFDDPWYGGGPWGGWGPGFGPYGGAWGGRGWHGGGWGWGGGGWYGAGFAPMANPWYLREVSVVLRDLSTQRVVYETRARSENIRSNDAAVLPVMFRAALQGFPVPPQGARQVKIEVVPAGAATPQPLPAGPVSPAQESRR